LRILIAEDDPDIWTPYRIALEKRGHIVDIVQDGIECVEKYNTVLKGSTRRKKSDEDGYSNYHDGNYSSKRTTTNNGGGNDDQALSSSSPLLSLSPQPSPPYDAIVLDYRMPKKDGLQVAREILESNPSQRIIFASAYVKETLKESVKELRQVVELMQKPFLPEALVEVVEDTEAYPELKRLFVNVRNMTESDFENPPPDLIKDILDGLKKIQKGRTF
jgi:two-component system, chemotaxis family, chemotaxis protein CheY